MSFLQEARLIFLLPLVLFTMPAQAERADRNKPIQIEAQKITIDEAKKIQILEGDVLLTKGTLVIQAERVVITEDRYGFQKGTAFGSPEKLARFRQKREGSDQYIRGEAERIEYDTSNEIAQLFERAWVMSGDDQIRGDYIWYDSISEKFLVSSRENGSRERPARVHALIQPKNKTAASPVTASTKNADPLFLQGAQGLSPLPSPGPTQD